eukprot:g6347.t1
MRLAKEGEARSGPSTGAGMMGGAAGNGGALSIGGDGKKRNGREENQGADNGAGEAEDDEGDHVDDDDDDDDDNDDGDQDEVRPCQLTSVRKWRYRATTDSQKRCESMHIKTLLLHSIIGRDQNAVEAAVGLLRSHGPMLTDYFSISFDDGGALASLPEVAEASKGCRALQSLAQDLAKAFNGTVCEAKKLLAE